MPLNSLEALEKYTEAMKHNLEHFSEIMENWYAQIPEEMRTEDKFLKLASHKGEDVVSGISSKYRNRNHNRHSGLGSESVNRQYSKLLQDDN